jgi:hypothetical protein
MPKVLSQNKHMTKERGNKCGRRGTKSAKDESDGEIKGWAWS